MLLALLETNCQLVSPAQTLKLTALLNLRRLQCTDEDELLICHLTRMKRKAGTEIVLYSLFATASQPREDRPLANECNNYSFKDLQAHEQIEEQAPPHPQHVTSKEEDPGFLGNGILACVILILNVCLQCTVYIYIYSESIFASTLTFYKALLWYSCSIPPSQPLDSVMSALYGL